MKILTLQNFSTLKIITLSKLQHFLSLKFIKVEIFDPLKSTIDNNLINGSL